MSNEFKVRYQDMVNGIMSMGSNIVDDIYQGMGGQMVLTTRDQSGHIANQLWSIAYGSESRHTNTLSSGVS